MSDEEQQSRHEHVARVRDAIIGHATGLVLDRNQATVVAHLAVEALEDLIWSTISVGDGGAMVLQTWRQLAEARGELGHLAARWSQICADLDRCEHGRHEGDECSGCGGPSVGNRIIGHSVIGHGLDGREAIAVPSRGLGKSDPARWRNPVR